MTDGDTDTNKAAEHPFDVVVYDLYGREKLKGKTKVKKEKLRLNTKSLPEGVYELQIRNPEGIVHKQLQIKR